MKKEETMWDAINANATPDVELTIYRDQLGRVVKLSYTVNKRKSDKTFTEFQTLVDKLVEKPAYDATIEELKI